MGTATTKTETGLTCNTAYTRYVWAYNGCGNSTTAALNQSTTACSFNCGQPMIDARASKSYNTVQIGTQRWMAQNLDVGTKILNAVTSSNNGLIEKYCYNDDDANWAIYGGLYRWDELMNYTTASNTNPSGRQGICPDGWHLPSDVEWCQMEAYLDPTSDCNGTGFRGTDIAGKLKEAGTTHWTAPNTGATNSSGFTGLPNGLRYGDGGYNNINLYAYFWNSAENGSSEGWRRCFYYNYAQTERWSNAKKFALGARRVKD